MDTLRNNSILEDPEIAGSVSRLSQLRFLNIDSEISQQQEIVAPYTIVLERFLPQQSHGEIEILDGNACTKHTMTRKEYQYMQQRPMHSHHYLELMLVLSGAVLNHVEDESFVYREGQGCIMNSNIRHKEEPAEECEVLFVELRREFLQELFLTMGEEGSHFQGSVITNFLQDAISEDPARAYYRQYLDFSPSGKETKSLSEQCLCGDALRALRKKEPGCSYLIRAAILRFLSDLGDTSQYTLQKVSSETDHKTFLVSKIDLLLRASHGKIRKEEMEKKLSYNGDYLNRIYRQLKGRSISDACREVRLQDTCFLLRHSEKSIDEIMDMLGITGRGYFFLLFQKETGMTPKQYRAKYKE